MLSFFKVPFENINIVGNIFSCQSKKKILMLHGGSPESTMERFKPLRKELLKNNISTISFDFVGHGLTGGEMTYTSLRNRTDQLIKVIDFLSNSNLSILATSMSAYNLIKVINLRNIASIILTVPAVYHSDAYDINFGPKFSNIIRQYHSWLNTDAWSEISKFRGKLIIISAGNDQVIDKEIPQRLYDSATSASSRKIFTINESTHLIFPFFNKNYNQLKWFGNIIESQFK